MSTPQRAVVILAAGLGKRMHSATPKVLHRVLGEPMLGHVLRTAHDLGSERTVVVTGHGRAAVEAYVAQWAVAHPDAAAPVCIEQVDPHGTGHAMQCALPALAGATEVLVLYGDVPLLRGASLAALLAARGDGPLSLLVTDMPDPTGYGRVLLDADNRIASVIEHKDASELIRKVTVINAGMMALDAEFLRQALGDLRADNAQGELYLTDLVRMAAERGRHGVALKVDDAAEVQGVNNRLECALATKSLRRRINEALMLSGVGLEDPDHAWIEASVHVEPDCRIGAEVELRGATRVAAGAVIERGCVLTDCEVGPGAHFLPYCVAAQAVVGPDAHVGPFAHLRPGSVLEAKVKVGNFVETKKTTLRRGAKASHLSYLGDADIGADCNIGAGTITCNYDGKNKFQTILGNGVFIGSDSQLVAPVTVGDGAYVGAGTTVTSDVPAGALAVSRTAQRNVEGWVARKQARDAGEGHG